MRDNVRTKYDLDFWMKEKDGIPWFTCRDDEIVPVESGHMASKEHT